MTGFRNFILKGNLVDISVAFIMGLAFAAVVTTFTTVITDVVAKIIGKNPNFDTWAPGGVHLGAFLTALIAFLIMAAVVYFFVVTPYLKAKERFFPEAAAGDPADIALLREIRDAIQSKGV
jgi:large conductance mechanosensitive channel